MICEKMTPKSLFPKSNSENLFEAPKTCFLIGHSKPKIRILRVLILIFRAYPKFGIASQFTPNFKINPYKKISSHISPFIRKFRVQFSSTDQSCFNLTFSTCSFYVFLWITIFDRENWVLNSAVYDKLVM